MKFKALICLLCLYYRILLAFSPRLIYANRRDIRIVRTSQRNQNETVVVDGLEGAVAVDFCYADGLVFWTDVTLEKIKRIRVTGDRKVEDVISVGLKKPEGLAVDWIAKKLYWTDCRDSDWETNRIEVADLDGKNRKVLFWKDLGLPRAVALDPPEGVMFWTDWGEEPKIERAEMDGTNRTVIVKENIYWPNGLTIDYTVKKVYWTDAKLLYVAKANYDGSNVQRILETPQQCQLGQPFALTVYENKIYWTDWKTRAIHSTNKNTGLRCQVVSSKLFSPMDIHVFEQKRQSSRRGENPCNSTTNGGCSHLCLLNSGGHSCACPTGVRLLADGKTCEEGPVHFLLLARRVDVRRISLDTPELMDVVVPVADIRHGLAIDFDPVDKFVYWSDDEKLEITRSRMDGKDVEVLVSNEVKHPAGIAVDWVARNLYWTDTGTDRIEVSRLNGSFRKVVISEYLDEPRAIALDPSKGHMYWTDWGHDPKIERAGLDGSERVILVNASIAWPNGITIDFQEDKIYWVDAKLDKIEVMDMDGKNRKVVLDHELPHVFGFTVLGDNLFWTDWQRRSIESVSKHTGKERRMIIDSLPDLMGLKAVNLNFTHGSNPCQDRNGGCSHLCLFRPSGVNCECPSGMELLADMKNCILPEAFLLFSNHDDIRRISLDTNSGKVIPLVGVQEANALDFNVHDMQIYWTDLALKSISRAFLNGSGVEDLVVVDLIYPDGLAVDWLGKNLFWTDSQSRRIEVARLNGQHRKMLIWRDLYEPRDLILDPVSGYMYWANGGNHPSIERADLDGTNRWTVISNVTRPSGLTIDFSAGLIFWADSENKVIECANLNGTNRRTIASELPKPFALTQYKDYIYWTDWTTDTINRANKTNGQDRVPIKSSIDYIMDILVFHSSRQEGWNGCAINNGGCTHLCLAKPGNRLVCACPTHFFMHPDNKTCKAPGVFMLYSTKKDIRRILLNSSDNLDVVLPVHGLSNALAIDYDINRNLVFWIDGATKTIRSSFQNGTYSKIVVMEDNASPHDLAIDSYGQQMFWTDSASNEIKVYSLKNKTSVGIVFYEPNVYPRSIVLYPEIGQMFFTNDDPRKKSIMQASLGGADKQILFNAEAPGDLAVDKEGKKLFWIDTALKKIEYADLTGRNRDTLVDTNMLHPVGLAVYGDYVYWIDRKSRNVMKIKKTNQVHGSTVQAEVHDLTDMLVVDTTARTVHHPCSSNSCTHICLVGKNDDRAQCSCPMNMILMEDNSTCGAPKTCSDDEFSCPDGGCYSLKWRCNGAIECNDGADEKNCTTCLKGAFLCNNQQCISEEKLCNTEEDCEDGTDEDFENCPLICSSSEFGCLYSGKCIVRDWLCDGVNDCGDSADEKDCNSDTGNKTTIRSPRFHHSKLSAKMVGVIVASIIVCVIFLTVVVLMCRRLKHAPDCHVAHEIGLVVTPVMHGRAPLSSSSSTITSHNKYATPLRKGPGSAGSSSKRSKSMGVVPSVSNRSSASQLAYDRNNLTGASCSSTASTVITAYPQEPLNPPPSPVTERSQYTLRSRPYCESLMSPSSCASHRYHRPRMPPPPTPVSTDVESVGSRHRCRRPHRCRNKRYIPASSCTEVDLMAPPPTPNTNYLSEATHFSDQECPPSPTVTEKSSFLPYPPPPSPVTDAPSLVL